jgi:L-threonylcarbamoyladenylate synthase
VRPSRRDLVTTDVASAAACLTGGGLVAIPTETVYGLGADAENERAVGRIFDTKGRPVGHPLIVHVPDAGALSSWAARVPVAAKVLAGTCWPGPLTLLVPRADRVLDVVTGGRDSVGLRAPAHPLTQALLARSGRGIAAPSANLFGRVSPTTADHVLADLGGRLSPGVDVILDGGPSPIGVESTIVDCTTDPPQLLRPGGIPREDIERLLDIGLAPATGGARAPGMLASHYSPEATVVLARDRRHADEVVTRFDREGLRFVVLDFGDDLVTYARQLYRSLRDADATGADRVVAVLPPARGLGHAIRDRLEKAAATRGDRAG